MNQTRQTFRASYMMLVFSNKSLYSHHILFLSIFSSLITTKQTEG